MSGKTPLQEWYETKLKGELVADWVHGWGQNVLGLAGEGVDCSHYLGLIWHLVLNSLSEVLLPVERWGLNPDQVFLKQV